MRSLNPFLRAFFRSTLPSQCTPVEQHILLVPTTEVLLTYRDRETNAPFTELVLTDELLASHVLRIPSAVGREKEIGSVRDNRGKARQFTTLNGRTLVIKESFVYSNKGFKNLNQAQLLSDALYYHDTLEAQQWLIYYISKPLTGNPEPVRITSANLPDIYAGFQSAAGGPSVAADGGDDGSFAPLRPGKRAVRTFNDLLNNFPMIARQMHPGLDHVLNDFHNEVGKPLPALNPEASAAPVGRRSSVSSVTGTDGPGHGRRSPDGRARSSSFASTVSAFADDEEDHMRRSLEAAVTAAIDLFQLVDKQQLSLLGATTELTGPIVERLIERYVTEHLHDSVLLPRLCRIHRMADLELESNIHHMTYIDIAQVGIEIEGGREGKHRLTGHLNLGIAEFKKLSAAGSPQQMIEILLATQKIITTTGGLASDSASLSSEKHPSPAMSADALVSLLLIVVIRSHVRHLSARLAYMRNFIFIEDVEGGEIGYALSTFEAVISYLMTDAGGLRIASRRNKRLWRATKKGNLSEMKAILEPEDGSFSDEPDSVINGLEEGMLSGLDGEGARGDDFVAGRGILEGLGVGPASSSSDLSHVFPFQSGFHENAPAERPRPVKRVSLDLRSLSNVSVYSFRSRTSTTASGTSGIEGDTSIEKLCQTQDHMGNSVLMMAIQARQPEALDYLLSLEEFYPMDVVLADCDDEGTTLLSAAVQSAHAELIDIVVDYVLRSGNITRLRAYIGREDNRGRSLAHYLFHAPQLLSRFGTLLPWRRKDRSGQTPLLALCRSYDHPRYPDMVNDALHYATDEQGDGMPLHVDDHVDAKGNTLLHVVSDPLLALRILQHCDADPNATNDKKFTPLMVASKFGRFDLVRVIFLDKRVDVLAKEHRGMTAVELAKDDEVRNRIDDMVLVSNIPTADDRVSAVVRSFFMDDGSVKVIIKSASRHEDGMIAVTTCRRSLSDFEHLAKWLSIEHPSSWLPSILNFRSPCQIPSRPSRAVLYDVHTRLDKFLRIMLEHSTFSTHELLWEFILVPEIQPEMMAERSIKKAEIRQERIREEYEPVQDVRDIVSFVSHARESIRGVHHSTKSVVRRVNGARNASADFFTALELATGPFNALAFLPQAHVTAFARYARALQVRENDPVKLFHQDMQAIQTTVFALLSSLSRPHALVNSLQDTTKAMDRHRASLRRSDRWPLGLLEETRRHNHLDALERIQRAEEELRSTGCELRFTQQVVAAELAGWQDLHGKMARRAVRRLAEGMLIRERDRLEGMRRALRCTVAAAQTTLP